MQMPTERMIPGGRPATSMMIALGVFGLVAPVLTFFLAISGLPDSAKIFLLVLLALGYSIACLWSFQKARRQGWTANSNETPTEVTDVEVGLNSMTEASEFFGGSIKPADLFRLVSSRVAEFFPFAVSLLFVAAESGDTLRIVQAHGRRADAFEEVELPIESAVAGMSWLSGEVETDGKLEAERRSIPDSAVDGLRVAYAIPLLHDEKPFAVLVLYAEGEIRTDPETQLILEAIGRRVAPLFLSSLSFERTLSNALTDSLTSLPNERAFYMVLENQLAESQRHRDERPLTILSIDIKDFADTNQSYGFAAGDRMLAFTAEGLASQLRKMDFLSRATNDEFLIILPTASEKFGSEIIQRIRHRFASEAFAISETDHTKVWLNFGWATFWKDGETAEQLLQNARIRKQQAKAEEPSKVLWFPKEYVN
jgi:diguanylate cyclase (GGDEF)-like protein